MSAWGIRHIMAARQQSPAPVHIHRRVPYTITDLGLVKGYEFSQGDFVNERGQTAGVLEDEDGIYSFFKTSGQPMTNIGTLGGRFVEPHALSETGQVVGTSENSSKGFRAYLWQNGRMTDLGTLGGDHSVAYSINSRGQIVGVSDIAPSGAASVQQHRGIQPARYELWALDCWDRACLWQNGQIKNISARCPGPWNAATAINDEGDIAGIYKDAAMFGDQAFVIRNNQAQRLPTLGGDTAFAVALSRSMVVGYSTFEKERADPEHGCVWRGSHVVDIGTLGGEESRAFGVNERGQVVGWADDAEGLPHAILWQNGKLTDLNKLISPSSGWYLQEAAGINNRGQIVGNGGWAGDEYHAFLLTPENQSK